MDYKARGVIPAQIAVNWVGGGREFCKSLGEAVKVQKKFCRLAELVILLGHGLHGRIDRDCIVLFSKIDGIILDD